MSAPSVGISCDAPMISPDVMSYITGMVELDKSISLSVKNATLTEIMIHLAKIADISVMARWIGCLEPGRISVEMQAIPLRDALDIIANAFNLKWHKEGMVYVLYEPALLAI